MNQEANIPIESYKRSDVTFVSLGLNCEVAHQLRIWRNEVYSDSKISSVDGNLPSGAHFFDWNISSIDAVNKCLSVDFNHVFEKNNIEITETRDGAGMNYVIDRYSGIMFHHIFSRKSCLVTKEIFEDEFESRSEKVQYLINKFKSLLNNGNNIVFIRRANDQLNSIYKLGSLIQNRMHGRNYWVANIRSDRNDGTHVDEQNRIIFMDMQYSNGWQGDPEAWKNVLLSLKKISESREVK